MNPKNFHFQILRTIPEKFRTNNLIKLGWSFAKWIFQMVPDKKAFLKRLKYFGLPRLRFASAETFSLSFLSRQKGTSFRKGSFIVIGYLEACPALHRNQFQIFMGFYYQARHLLMTFMMICSIIAVIYNVFSVSAIMPSSVHAENHLFKFQIGSGS